MNVADFVTTGQAAAEITQRAGVFIHAWQVARVFERNYLPDPGRIAGRRAIPRTMIPEIVAVMRTRGWLPAQEEVAHA